MQEREVTDQNSTVWKCIQPLSGVEGKLADKALELIKEDNGKVPVACTPSGGEQSVHVKLNEDWFEKTSDETLVAKIEEAKRS